MGAGFAAGFFGEATNIMRERSKNKREDELIAEERKQKELDWARQTKHDMDMVTARYDLETRAARTEKAKKAETIATNLVAAGFKPEELAPYLKDPDQGMFQLETLLDTVTRHALSPTQVRSTIDTIGIDGISDETAATVKDTGAAPSRADLAFRFASAASPKSQSSPEEIRFVTEKAVGTLRTSAMQERDKWNTILLDDNASDAQKQTAADKIATIDTSLEEADEKGNISLLLKDYGVKSVYDMMNNQGFAGYDILSNPDLLNDPAVVQKAQDIAGTTEFLGEQVDTPYDALSLITTNAQQLVQADLLGETLQDFIVVYDKSFLPPELKAYYEEYINKQNQP